MKYAFATVLSLMMFSSPAFANGSCPSGRFPAHGKLKPVYAPCHSAELAVRHGIGFYPPTYLIDGRAYYYYPGSNGRKDEPVQPPLPDERDY